MNHIDLSKKLIMGILNTSPDSFYDGGRYSQLHNALKQAQTMIHDGADIIDIGGESSRPGSIPITLDEEEKRVLPVVKEIMQKFPKTVISIDTYKPDLAEKALQLGATIINDIFGLRNIGMAEVVSEYEAYIVIMHMKGEPFNMQLNPIYKNVVNEVYEFFQKQVEFALKKGIQSDKIILDPGIGFGKNLEDNLKLMKASKLFKELGFPLLIGASRKSLIGKMLNNTVEERKNSSVILHTLALNHGADILRVHDVKETSEAIKIYDKWISV